MSTRFLGASSAGAAFALTAFLQVFETQGWTMPDWIGVVLVVGIAIFGGVAALAALNELAKGAGWLRRQVRLRSPVIRKDTPDPNQWLLDIAHEHADNPASQLILLKSRIVNRDLREETRRKWIELGFVLLNTNVHEVEVGPAAGHMMFRGDELADAVDAGRGWSRKPRGHSHEYRLRQIVPADVAQTIMEDLREHNAVSCLDTARVRVPVRCVGSDRTAEIGLGETRFAEGG